MIQKCYAVLQDTVHADEFNTRPIDILEATRYTFSACLPHVTKLHTHFLSQRGSGCLEVGQNKLCCCNVTVTVTLSGTVCCLFNGMTGYCKVLMLSTGDCDNKGDYNLTGICCYASQPQKAGTLLPHN